MNRSLLLIICDFLLISILSLVRLESTSVEDPRNQREEIRHSEGMQDDMVELLRLSLEEEAAQREALRASLEEREAELAEREAALEETSRDRDQTAEELQQIRQEREALAAERTRLQEEFAETQGALQETTAERERIAAELEAQRRQARQLQEELQRRQQALAAAEDNLAQLEARAEELAQARNELATNLQISQAERALLEENLVSARAEVERARVERQQAEERAEELASNVGALAESSTAIQEEIRRAQPISLNEIFSRYERNRLRLRFDVRVDALFGSRSESTEINAILVRSGGRTMAVFESSLTPFEVEALNRLREADVSFQAGSRRFNVTEVSFLQADPRVIAIQIPEEVVSDAGLTPFEIASEPLRFPEVVLVSNELGEFGEANFRLLPGGQRYLSVPNRLLGRIFGDDFGASRGDYIFAKTGNLMGVMLSSEYGAILSDLQPAAHLRLGTGFDPDRADQLHDQLISALLRTPVPPRGATTTPRR